LCGGKDDNALKVAFENQDAKKLKIWTKQRFEPVVA
jgi:hypothetical protein